VRYSENNAYTLLTNAYIAYTLLRSARQVPCPTEECQMARPRFLPAVPSRTVTISTILELPGAIFYGSTINDPDALDSAVRRQAIRADFELTCLTTLRHDLMREGFGAADIAAAILNPKTITDCGYGLPPGY
jgi:hypothetical protein